jgi:hypothetical protein
MEPYATASDPSPLNGNRPTVNGNNSFFTEYRTQILYSIGFVIFVVFVAVSTRGKYSWYDHGKVGIKKKKSKKDKKKAADTPKKDKKGSKVKPAGKCPAGCVPAGMEKKKVPNLSKTSFDPALTDKKPKVEGTRQ